jgi:hypothetical protein
MDSSHELAFIYATGFVISFYLILLIRVQIYETKFLVRRIQTGSGPKKVEQSKLLSVLQSFD